MDFKERDMKLKKKEDEILLILANAYNKFGDLPILHEADTEDFLRAIHMAQNIVMSRPVMRQINKENKEG